MSYNAISAIFEDRLTVTDTLEPLEKIGPKLSEYIKEGHRVLYNGNYRFTVERSGRRVLSVKIGDTYYECRENKPAMSLAGELEDANNPWRPAFRSNVGLPGDYTGWVRETESAEKSFTDNDSRQYDIY